MKKSKLKLHKTHKSKSARSLLIGLVLLTIAVILVYTYARNTEPPLIAGVMDSYQQNLLQKAGGATGYVTNNSVDKGKTAGEIKATAAKTLVKIAEKDTTNKELQAQAKQAQTYLDAGLKAGTITKTDEDNANATVNADEAKIAASYAQVNAKNTTGGRSCPGANSGIGAGQWAQTGGGVYKTNPDGSKALIPGSHGCVQCGGGGDGVWGKTVVQCGEGEATNYIVRPDELIDCKAKDGDSCKLKNNCWKNGVYYSDSSSLGGEGCVNGSWKLLETDDALNNAKATADAEQGKKEACENDGVGHYYKGICYSSETTMNAKIAYDERMANPGSGNTTTDCTRSPCTKSACDTQKNSKLGGGSCAIIQGTDKYGFIPAKSGITSISYVPGVTADRPTSFLGGVSDKTYNSKSQCEAARRADETCTPISGATGIGSGGYKLAVGKAFITLNFGTQSSVPQNSDGSCPTGTIHGNQTTTCVPIATSETPKNLDKSSASGYGNPTPANPGTSSTDTTTTPCPYGYKNQSTECADAPASTGGFAAWWAKITGSSTTGSNIAAPVTTTEQGGSSPSHMKADGSCEDGYSKGSMSNECVKNPEPIDETTTPDKPSGFGF